MLALEDKGDAPRGDFRMDNDQPAPAHPGDTWAILVGGSIRYSKVIRPGDAPGWWLCRDVETGIEFSAPQAWLIVRLDALDD